jgi:hypothetical protein
MALGQTAQKTLDRKVIGDEPAIGAILNTNTKLIDALNYYNYLYSRKEAIDFLHKYLEKTDKETLKVIKKVPDINVPTTLGWIARMAHRQCVLPDATHEFFNRNVKSIIDRYTVKEAAAPVAKKETKPASEFPYLMFLEEQLDIFTQTYSSDFKFAEWAAKSSLPIYAIQHIQAYYKPLLAELEAIQKDKAIKEGFRHLNTKQRNAYVEFVRSFVDGSSSVIHNRQAVKKPRKRRTPKLENIIKGLKYQAEEKTLNVASIAPAKIIGANQLITFNTKTRKLSFYVAEKAHSLTIKGSTLMNVDLKASKERTVRKPHEIIPKVAKAGKRELNKIFNSLTTTETNIDNGRINKNHILLMVF